MATDRFAWWSRTHDWRAEVDLAHLAAVRAESLAGGTAIVTAPSDGSVTVVDHGRGTDTRTDSAGAVI